MAQTRRNQKQEKPISIWIGLVGVAAAIAAAVYRFPAWPVSWMFWLAAAWMHRPPQLTGRKDSSGRQTVAHHGEQKLMNRHTSWRAMRWSLLPGRSLNPGWPMRLPFVWGIILAALSAVMLPVPQTSWRLANAAGALLTVTGLAAARRAGAAEDDVCPGVTVADLDGVRGHREWVVGGLVAGLAVAIVALTAPLPFTAPVHMALVAGALTSLAVLTAAATKFGLADWWHLVNRRRELAPGWQALKIDPAPRLIATREVGPATVDTFDAPPGLGAIGVFNLGPKLSTVMPSGSTIAILDVPSENTNGDPIVGSHHPRKFEVVSWPQGDIPNVMDPAIDQQVAELLFRCAPVWSWVAVGFARPAFVEAQRLTTDDSPAALWRVVYDFPLGPGWGSVKIEADKLGGALQTEAWIDASSGMALVGANVNDFDVAFLEEAPFDVPKGKPLDQYVKETIDDAKWAQRWRDALKLGQQPPVYQPATLQERPFESASGSSGSVNIAGFLVNQGVDPMEYRGLEPKLATVLKAAPFVAVLGYPAPGSAQGSRHPQAFRVAWSHSAPPKSPDLLPPGDTLASTVLLGGMINRAFDSCRLARPEVMGRGLACLTSPSSQRHLWQVNLRLYDGLTVNDVRAKERNIQSSLQVPYLRIVATDDRSEIVMILGEHHSRVKLATPEQTGFKLERNDWDTWFALAGVVAGGGERPVLVAKEPVDTSDHLIRYTFEYPPGLAYAMVKARADNLKTTAQVAYLNPQQIPGDAARFEVIVGEKFPLPERCGFDFDAATAMGRRMFPFAWGVLGKPVGWSIDDDPHQLISGGTGSGKELAYATILPTPVSERFPTGWARNDELVEGDEIYGRDGTICRIIGFTPWRTADTFEVEFSDGQVVTVGGTHLWRMSDRAGRKTQTPSKVERRSKRADRYIARASELRSIAADIPVGTFASAADIAALIGEGWHRVHEFARAAGIPSELAIRSTAQQDTVTSQQSVTCYPATDAYRLLLTAADPIAGVDHEALAHLEGSVTVDEWASLAEIAQALFGESATMQRRHMIRRRLVAAGVPSKTCVRAVTRSRGAGRCQVTLWHVPELIEALAVHTEGLALTSDSRRQAQPVEKVVDTYTIAASLTTPTGHRNWAVRLTEAIDGPDVELPIPPYVFGAWLGDGDCRHGNIAAGSADSCTDANGVTDHQHMRREIESHGYLVDSVGVCRNDLPLTLSSRSLRSDLRNAGLVGADRSKHIPAIYLRASKAQRLAVLQGLMDTDGSVDTQGACELTLSDERLANGAIELIRSLGIRASIRSSEHKYHHPDDPEGVYRPAKDRHRIVFTTNLPVFRLPRKLERLPLQLRPTQQWNYVVDVRQVPSQKMRCLRVDNVEAMHLVEGFIPTHNSVSIQSVLFGALSKGWIVALADPTKGGADFQFAEPYCVAFEDTIEDTATMLKQVYAEVIARKKTNAINGVGSYKDLPEEVRPDPMLVVIDEFFSLVAPLKVPAKSDNPESEALRKNVTEMNFAKATILDIVGRIAREARSAGVHLCLAAQRPDGKLLEGEMKFNLSGRILMGTASTNDRRVALRSALDAPVVEPGSPKGRGICESSTGYPELIQGWFAEQQQFADALSKVREPISDDDRLRLLPPAPTLIDTTIEVEETWVGDHDGSTDAIWDSPGGASAWSTSAVPEWDPKTAAVPADQPMTGGSDVLDFALEEVIEEQLNDDDFEDDDDFVFDLTEPEPEAQPAPADIPSPPRDLATFPPPTTPSMMPQPASLPPPPPGTPAAQAFAPPTTRP